MNHRFQLTVIGVSLLLVLEVSAFGLFCARAAFQEAKGWILSHPDPSDFAVVDILVRKQAWFFAFGVSVLFVLHAMIGMLITNRIAGPLRRLQNELKTHGLLRKVRFRSGDYAEEITPPGGTPRPGLPGMKDEDGFTVFEVMIGASVAAVIALNLAQTLVNSGIGANTVRMEADLNSLMSGIQLALNNPTQCAAAFRKAAGTTRLPIDPGSASVDVPNFYLGPAALATEGLPTVGNQVTAMKLTNPTLQVGNQYLWSFNVTVTKTGVSLLGQPVTIRHFNVLMTTNGSPTFVATTCTGSSAPAGGSTLSGVCIDAGGSFVPGTPNKCVFPEALVGPDNTFATATSPLFVKSTDPTVGFMGIGLASGEIWGNGGNNSLWEITNTGNQTGGFAITYNYDPVTYPLPNPANPTAVPLMSVLNDGRVGVYYAPSGPMNGIPSVPNTGEKFYVNGGATITGTLTATNFVNTSDARLKTDIRPLEGDPLAEVLALQGVTFRWKPKSGQGGTHAKEKQIGMVAQDVEKVLPGLLGTDSRGMKAIKYYDSLAVLIEAAKALNQKVETQNHELEQLRARLCTRGKPAT